MSKYNVICLSSYKENKKITSPTKIEGAVKNEEEERKKTLNLFMKVIATMYKESCK